MDITSAYNIITGLKNPYQTYELINKLEENGLIIPDEAFQNIIPIELHSGAKKLVQQILLRSGRHVNNTKIIKHFAGDKTPKSIGFPKDWIDILERNDVKINSIGSKINFFKNQIRALYRALKTYRMLSKTSRIGFYPIKEEHIILPHTPINAVREGHDKEYVNFIAWLRANDTQYEKATILAPQHHYFPKLSLKKKIRFHWLVVQYFYKAMLKWICGYWQVVYILEDLFELAYFDQIEKTATTYLFNNSNFAVRPLWTYKAEQNQTEIILYFYSINCQLLSFTKFSPTLPSYKSLSWPQYWVIDSDQKRFLNKCCNIQEDRIYIKGAIDYIDIDKPIPFIPENSIAMFDIPIYQSEYLASRALICPFYTMKYIEKFVNECVRAAQKNNMKIVWKPKRDMSGRPETAQYNAFVESYRDNSNVIMVDSDVSAARVIEKCAACISIPYTSTYLAAKQKNVPSIYYDYTGQIFHKSNSKIVQSYDDLVKWVAAILPAD